MSSVALARVAGLLYLAVAVLGAWAHSAGGSVYVAGDAGATAASVAANEVLIRWVIVADILMAVAFVFLGLALQRLLRAEGARLASAIVVFTAVSAGSVVVTLVFFAGAISASVDPAYAHAFGETARNGLVLIMLDLQHAGSVLGGVFFGLWLVPVGVLVYRSAVMPRALGVAVLVGAVSWVLGAVLAFAAPTVGRGVTLTVSSAAEVALLLWLLVVGVRRQPAIVR